MKKSLIPTLVILAVCAIFSFAANYTWTQQGSQNQKLGFGSVVSADSVGSISISSCDGMSYVDGTGSCQIGTGSNTDDGTLQYRSNKVPLVNTDTNATTTTTLYTPVMIGEILVGATGGVDVAWISTGLTTNDWLQISP